MPEQASINVTQEVKKLNDEKLTHWWFEAYRDKSVDRKWRYHVQAANGEIVFPGGESFSSKHACLMAINRINSRFIAKLEIKIIT